MNYEFEKVINGIAKYINNEIYPGMNQLQEFAARVAVSLISARITVFSFVV